MPTAGRLNLGLIIAVCKSRGFGSAEIVDRIGLTDSEQVGEMLVDEAARQADDTFA